VSIDDNISAKEKELKEIEEMLKQKQMEAQRLKEEKRQNEEKEKERFEQEKYERMEQYAKRLDFFKKLVREDDERTAVFHGSFSRPNPGYDPTDPNKRRRPQHIKVEPFSKAYEGASQDNDLLAIIDSLHQRYMEEFSKLKEEVKYLKKHS